MNKLHIAVAAALVALAVVAGTLAVTRTTGLGSSARSANDAAVAAKTRQLAAYERGLARALAAKMPALPKLRAGSAGGAAAPVRVVYHRPPPVVVVKHTHHGDDGFESANGGGRGDD